MDANFTKMRSAFSAVCANYEKIWKKFITKFFSRGSTDINDKKKFESKLCTDLRITYSMGICLFAKNYNIFVTIFLTL